MARFDPRIGDEVTKTWALVEVPYSRLREAGQETIYEWLTDRSRRGFYEMGMHELFDDVIAYRFSDPQVAFEFKMRFA